MYKYKFLFLVKFEHNNYKSVEKFELFALTDDQSVEEFKQNSLEKMKKQLFKCPDEWGDIRDFEEFNSIIRIIDIIIFDKTELIETYVKECEELKSLPFYGEHMGLDIGYWLAVTHIRIPILKKRLLEGT